MTKAQKFLPYLFLFFLGLRVGEGCAPAPAQSIPDCRSEWYEWHDSRFESRQAMFEYVDAAWLLGNADEQTAKYLSKVDVETLREAALTLCLFGVS